MQDTLSCVAAYYEIASTISDTFTAELSFEYTEALLLEAGIHEDDLMIAWYDSAAMKWKAVPTVVDVINRIAMAQTGHFSLWGVNGQHR